MAGIFARKLMKAPFNWVMLSDEVLVLAATVCSCIGSCCTVKPVLSGHSKIDITKVSKMNGSLMRLKVLQNALLEHSAILLTCIKR